MCLGHGRGSRVGPVQACDVCSRRGRRFRPGGHPSGAVEAMADDDMPRRESIPANGHPVRSTACRQRRRPAHSANCNNKGSASRTLRSSAPPQHRRHKQHHHHKSSSITIRAAPSPPRPSPPPPERLANQMRGVPHGCPQLVLADQVTGPRQKTRTTDQPSRGVRRSPQRGYRCPQHSPPPSPPPPLPLPPPPPLPLPPPPPPAMS